MHTVNSMASSSTSFIQKAFKYDVFLSFRGDDTRKTFIDHLYHALENKGIKTYKDDEKIEKGKRIGDELMGSIEESRFYIIVLSKNYTFSSWCLKELVKIMECRRMEEHTAYPVFYDVEPTDIRKQTGPVKRAFAKHRKEIDVGRWRDAMEEAANLAGWELKNTDNGHEAKFIHEIVNKISLKLLSMNLSVDKSLVGMDGRVHDVVSSLEIGINDVRVMGIKGMGGAGKTTLARAIFDQISNWFEGSSFVENVREASNVSPDGLKSLQNQILSDVLNDQGISVSGVSDGKNKMKKMLSARKVLVVLDDVDNMNQLKALAGEPNWFKPGSRIIITTRDEQILVAHRVNFIRENANCLIYNVNLLSYKEAICLFSRNAFGTESPIQGYEYLSQEVIHYAAGLPLTVTVLGSFLCDRSDLEWKDALERLKTIPLEETLQKLELSYNGLPNDYKEIFLDVACMLKGWNKDDAIVALKSCGFHAEIGLRVLEQKSLITISSNGYLDMHDHIEEMGKNIVRGLHPNEPHKHSRLWITKEIEAILANDLGTEATRCICLKSSRMYPDTIMKNLGKMKGLRFLYVDVFLRHRLGDLFLENQELYTSSQCLPDSLQYLCWPEYPFAWLANNFQVHNIDQLQMPNNRQLWEGRDRKVLNKLKYLNIRYSKLRTFDLGLTPNLETLILSICYNLVEFHNHGEIPNLKFLDLSLNSNLRIIHLGRIPNLEVLSLGTCNFLEELHMPVGSVKLKSVDILSFNKLRTLNLRHTLNLETLHVRRCDNLVEMHMPAQLKSLCLKYSSLRTLNLAHIRNLEEIIIEDCKDFVELSMPIESQELRFLKLDGSGLRTLDLARTLNLETLRICRCDNLVEVHMPAQLKSLCLKYSSLRTLNLAHIRNLEEIIILDCKDFVELSMPIESQELRFLKLDGSGLRTLDLARTLNLETLHICRCDNLVEVHMPAQLKSLHLKYSSLRTLNLAHIRNLEKILIEDCKDFVELIMPIESQELRFLKLDGSGLRTLDLAKTLNLETLCICGSLDLELHMPVEYLNLKTLVLHDLKLRNLDLDRTPNVEMLYIQDCDNLLELKLQAICSLQCLRAIKLEGIFLEVPNDLHKSECLEKLILSLKKIKQLPSRIYLLQHVRVLHRYYCSLLELPEDLGRFECFEEQIISHVFTFIRSDSDRSYTGHLISTDISNCSLLVVPEDLGRLKWLETNLNISNGMIRRLPNSICMLKHLRVLDLSNCYFLSYLKILAD